MKSEFILNGKTLVIKAGTDMDQHSAKKIRARCDELMCKYRIEKIIFDFEKTDFMDSAGVGIVLGRYKILKKTGGTVGVININKNVERVFNISGIYKIIRKYDSVDEAERQ